MRPSPVCWRALLGLFTLICLRHVDHGLDRYHSVCRGARFAPRLGLVSMLVSYSAWRPLSGFLFVILCCGAPFCQAHVDSHFPCQLCLDVAAHPVESYANWSAGDLHCGIDLLRPLFCERLVAKVAKVAKPPNRTRVPRAATDHCTSNLEVASVPTNTQFVAVSSRSRPFVRMLFLELQPILWVGSWPLWSGHCWRLL
jgi:hypothetical protein